MLAVVLMLLLPTITIQGDEPAQTRGGTRAGGDWDLYNRSRKANVYQNTSDSDVFQAEIHSHPINHWNGTAWIPANTTITEDAPDPYKWQMNTSEYWAFFPEVFTDDPIKFGVGSGAKGGKGKGGDDHYLTYQMGDVSYWDDDHSEDYIASPEAITGEVLTTHHENDTVMYYGAYNATDEIYVDANYTLKSYGLKESLTLESKPREPAEWTVEPVYLGFTATVKHPTTDMYVDGELIEPKNQPFRTNKTIEFNDAENVTRFKLPTPLILDANNNGTTGLYEIKKSGSNVLLRILTLWGWLNHTNTTYPVYIDPSPETINTGFDIHEWQGINFGSPTQDKLIVGTISTYVYRSATDFDTTVIDDEMTITKIDITLYIDSAPGSPDSVDMSGMTHVDADGFEGAARKYHRANDVAGFHIDADGVDFLEEATSFCSVGEQTETLKSVANTDLQNQLSDNYFTVGMTIHTEGGANNYIRPRSMDYNGNDPKIEVTYSSGPLPPPPPVFVIKDNTNTTRDGAWGSEPFRYSMNILPAQTDILSTDWFYGIGNTTYTFNFSVNWGDLDGQYKGLWRVAGSNTSIETLTCISGAWRVYVYDTQNINDKVTGYTSGNATDAVGNVTVDGLSSSETYWFKVEIDVQEGVLLESGGNYYRGYIELYAEGT